MKKKVTCLCGADAKKVPERKNWYKCTTPMQRSGCVWAMVPFVLLPDGSRKKAY